MKKIILFFIAFGYYAAFCQQEENLTRETKTPLTYEQLKKQGTTWKTVGYSGMGAGLILWMVAGAQAGTEATTSIVAGVVGAPTDYNENAGEGTAIIGTVFFVGGVAALVVGITKTSKAKRMQRENAVSFSPEAPSIFITPKVRIPNAGFTISLPIGK